MLFRREHRGNSAFLAFGQEGKAMYFSHMLYDAERTKTTHEQREADVRIGQMAAEFARLRGALRETLRGALHRGTATRTDAIVGDDAVVDELELAYLRADDHTGHLTSQCN
jgi:hypothetical protein